MLDFHQVILVALICHLGGEMVSRSATSIMNQTSYMRSVAHVLVVGRAKKSEDLVVSQGLLFVY